MGKMQYLQTKRSFGFPIILNWFISIYHVDINIYIEIDIINESTIKYVIKS